MLTGRVALTISMVVYAVDNADPLNARGTLFGVVFQSDHVSLAGEYCGRGLQNIRHYLGRVFPFWEAFHDAERAELDAMVRDGSHSRTTGRDLR